MYTERVVDRCNRFSSPHWQQRHPFVKQFQCKCNMNFCTKKIATWFGVLRQLPPYVSFSWIWECILYRLMNVDFVLHHSHWKRFRKGSLCSLYGEEGQLQQKNWLEKMWTYSLRHRAANGRHSQDTQAIHCRSLSYLGLRLRSKAKLSADMASNRYWFLWHQLRTSTIENQVHC